MRALDTHNIRQIGDNPVSISILEDLDSDDSEVYAVVITTNKNRIQIDCINMQSAMDLFMSLKDGNLHHIAQD